MLRTFVSRNRLRPGCQGNRPRCRSVYQCFSMRGVGLIEVLVALLILSIGMLGVARLQLNAKKAGQEAVQRSTAAALAQDILARIRGNPSALASYVTQGDGLGGGSITAEPTPLCESQASSCSAAQLAAHDLWEWEQAIDGMGELRNGQQTGGLVSPTACIQNNSGLVTVSIAWLGARLLSNPIANACGSGLGRYDTNDARRQLLTITTFVTQNL